FFFFQAEDGIRDRNVTGVQTCALPIYADTDASAGAWYPAGPQMNTLSISEFASQLAEYNALTLSGDIDLMDQPLTPAQMAICPLGGPPPGFLCTTPDAVGNVYGRSGSWSLGGAVAGF